jgi:hypothetical protein
MMSASGVQHREEGLTAQGRNGPAISKSEIAVYCVCSTKLIVQSLEDADFQYLEGGNDLPAKLARRRSKIGAKGKKRAVRCC